MKIRFWHSGLLVAIILALVSISFSQVKRTAVQEYKREKEILGRLEAADKALVWRQHLIKQLETKQFRAGQVSVVKMAFNLLSASYYTADKQTIIRELANPKSPRAVFEKELNLNFTRDESDSVFYRIDPVILNSFVAFKPDIRPVAFLMLSNCDCASFDTRNCCGMACDTLKACNIVQACGILTGQDCNGRCGGGEEEGS